MRRFAQKIIIHGINHWPEERHREDARAVFDRKVSILHIDQGAELILKAYLLHSGFLINRITQKKVKEGIKSGVPIDEYLNNDRTLDFEDTRQLCKRLMNLSTRASDTHPPNQLEGLENLHKKRNAIQHIGVRVYGKTEELIFNALQDLITVYETAGFRAQHFLRQVREFMTTI